MCVQLSLWKHILKTIFLVSYNILLKETKLLESINSTKKSVKTADEEIVIKIK